MNGPTRELYGLESISWSPKMSEHVCPWWGGYFIDNRLRRLLHNPERLLSPYVQQGMTVMDIGCGMGFFSIAMAAMVAMPPAIN